MSGPLDRDAAASTDDAASVADAAQPGDPALTEVTAAMTAIRESHAGGDGAGVPTDDEVAALEQAHEVLRRTLDRAERNG
jgi:hypothetical protein